MRASVFSLSLLLVACSHKRAATTVATPSAAPPPGPVASSPRDTPSTSETAHLSVSDDLARSCALRIDATRAPKFDYDEATLLSDDRDLLEQVAACVTTGPLKGHVVRLVGRTDPRGTDEYNLGLGERRANAVGDFLSRLGVPSSQLAETTRGEIDARGSDEGTWRLDRRVDLELAN